MYLLLWLFTTRIAIYEPLDALTRDKQTHELLPIFRRPIIVSKETTYLTEPRLPDGRGVDYVAALNARHSKGVTFENNAVVPLLRLSRQEFKTDDIRKRFFEMLGGQIQFRRADELVDVFSLDPRFNTNDDPVWEESRTSMQRPWKESELPAIAKWLKANRHTIEIVESAVTRTQHFLPAIHKSDRRSLMFCYSPSFGSRLSLLNLIEARSLLLAGENRFGDAWATSKLLFKLAAVSQSDLPESAVIYLNANLSVAIQNAIRIVRAIPADRPKIQRLSNEFEKAYQEAARVRSTINLELRLESLDFIQGLEGQEFFLTLNSPFLPDNRTETESSVGGELAECAVRRLMHLLVDPNELLHCTNQLYDSLDGNTKLTASTRKAALEEACRKLSPAKPLDAADRFENVAPLVPPWKYVKAAFQQDESISAVYISEYLLSCIVLHECRLIESDERIRTIFDIGRVEFALQIYRADHGNYPKSLDELRPRYLNEVSKDTIVGLPLVYRPVGKRYLLYSVGENGIDDGGPRTDTHDKGDDIGVPWY